MKAKKTKTQEQPQAVPARASSSADQPTKPALPAPQAAQDSCCGRA